MRERSELAGYLAGLGFEADGDIVRAPALGVTKEVFGEEQAVLVTISTSSVDRHGDVMRAEGAHFDRYRRNPVVLYDHDYSALPVGKSLWEKATSEGITAKPQFHGQTELSREVWALVRSGILNAWSVGFIPEDWGPLEGDQKGFEVRGWDLLEYSSVPVPANFEALTLALKTARITAPALVKSLGALGFRAPDLVSSEVRPDRVPAEQGKESGMDPKEVTVAWLEAEKPELVGQMKSQGAEEEAVKAAAEAEKKKAEAAKQAEADTASVEEKLAAARTEAAEAERARLKALKEAFTDKPEFALEQFEKGATLAEAQDAYRDVRLDDLSKENARLKAVLPEAALKDVPPVGFEGDAGEEKTHVERAKDYRAAHGGAEKCSMTEALRATAPKHA